MRTCHEILWRLWGSGQSKSPVRRFMTIIQRSSQVVFLSERTGFFCASGRSIHGYRVWPFPAGFMEIGEATESVAIRETKVEALADVAILSFSAVPNMPNIG